MRVTSVGMLGLSLALLVVDPRHAAAGPTTAEQHRDEGYRHVERAEWDEALRAYELAFASDQDPVSLYAIGRIHAQRGDCVRALDAFARFLETNPPPRARASAQTEIDRCRPATPPPPPPPPPDPGPPDGDPTDEPSELPTPARPHRSALRDPLGGVLVGSGVVAGGLGGYFYWRARDQLCADPCSGSYQSYQQSIARARTWRTGAIVAGGIGAALVVGGIVRWIVVGGDDEGAEVEVSWTPQVGGGGLVVAGRFW